MSSAYPLPSAPSHDAVADAALTVASRIYGEGTPGTSRRTPSIVVRNCHALGRRAVRFSTFGAPGHTPALLIVGQRRGVHRVRGLEVLIDLSLPFVELFATTDAFGEASVETELPDHPHVTGQGLVAQWFVRDAGSSGCGFSASRGIEFEFCAA